MARGWIVSAALAAAALFLLAAILGLPLVRELFTFLGLIVAGFLLYLLLGLALSLLILAILLPLYHYYRPRESAEESGGSYTLEQVR